MVSPSNHGGGAAARYVDSVYGGTFKPTQNQVAVSLQAVAVRQANPNCVSLTITNTGVTNITLSNIPGTVSGQGILLLGNGATMTLNCAEDAESPTFPWYAISDVAGGSVNVWESEQAFDTPVSKA